MRRVEVPAQVAASFARSTANYAAAFELSFGGADSKTPLLWAIAVFGGAPAAVRWCLLFGWTRLLRLNLGAQPSKDHVLGWAGADSDLVPGSTALFAASRVLQATNIVSVETSTVTWVTLVHCSRATARPLWAIARPFHHLTLRYLLVRAARAMDDASAPMVETA